MSEYTIQELRAMHIMSKPVLNKALEKSEEVLREEKMSHRAQVTISRLAMACESYDDVIDTLLAEIDRLNERKAETWDKFQCEGCETKFAVERDPDDFIDEPICPACSSDNVRDAK